MHGASVEISRDVPGEPVCRIPAEPAGVRRACWWIFVLTFAVYLIPSPIGPGHFIVTKSMAASWNDQARIATVESLAERGTMAIDHSKWGWHTGDKVLLREHWYSTKPPLLSAVGAVSYMVGRHLVKLVTGHELDYRHNEDLIYPYVTLTTSVLAFALLLVYFYRALHLVPLSRTARWWLFWALAIGSLYPSYSSVFNNHSVAGAGVFIGFYYVLKYRLGGRVGWWEALWAGIAVGFAGMNDITGALPFVVLFFVLIVLRDLPIAGLWPVRARQCRAHPALGSSVRPHEAGYVSIVLALAAVFAAASWVLIGRRGTAVLLFAPTLVALAVAVVLAARRRPIALLFLIGVLLTLIAHLFLNSRVTGNWLPTYIQSDVYIAVPPGYFGEVLAPEEAGALYWARWKYVGTALFGIRGVFLYTPALLIGLVAAFAAAFNRSHPLRAEAVSLLLAVLAGWGWVLFFASPNFGGTSFGYRYALAASPLLIFFCYMVFDDPGGATACRPYRAHPALPVRSINWKERRLISTLFRNAVAWGAVVGLIAIPYPWGIFGQLPATQCSIVESLGYMALNALANIP
jgi:hypothetical protein